MKKAICIVITALLFVSHISAQTEKGKTLIAISSALGIGGNVNGFSFTSTKSKSDNFESDPIKTFSFNLSPRVGYFVADNLVIGAEVFYGFSKRDDFVFGEDIFFDELKTNTYGGGPFVRYYFKTKRVLPFIEVGVILGYSNTKVRDSEGEEKTNLFNYGGGAGIAVPLGDRVSFDALLGYSHFKNRPKGTNVNFRDVFDAFSLRLGFSVYLGKSTKQNITDQ